MLVGGCDRSFVAGRTLGAGPALCPSLVSFDAVGVGGVNGNGSVDCLLSAASLDTVYLVDGRR